jgi:flagellar basal-body rod modification protein FlgD
MAVTSVDNSKSAAAAAAPAPPNPKGDMGSTDTFMKLLVAELKQQDPMDPMQARDMVAQLASLSSVQKLSTIDQKLGALQTGSMSSASMQTANLIGKTVTAQTNRLTLNSTGTPTGSYKLQSDADTVAIKVIDGQGQTVRQLDAGGQSGGSKSFEWDGRDATGKRVPNGTYNFAVTAQDSKGVPVPVSTEVNGLVSEITYENGAPEVVVGGAHVGLADVTTIAQ